MPAKKYCCRLNAPGDPRSEPPRLYGPCVRRVSGRGLRFSPAPLARCRRLRFPFLATWPPGGLGKTGFITRMHEGLLGGPVRVGRDPRDTLADLSSLLSGFALPLNDLSKIGHDPPR